MNDVIDRCLLLRRRRDWGGLWREVSASADAAPLASQAFAAECWGEAGAAGQARRTALAVEEGLSAERGSGSLHVRVAALRAHALAALVDGDVDGALWYLRRTVPLGEELGPAAQAETHLWLCEVHLDRGGPADFSAAAGFLATAHKVLAEASEQPGVNALRWYWRCFGARVRLEHGEVESAQRELEGLAQSAQGPAMSWRVAAAQAECSEVLGRGTDAEQRRQTAKESLEAMVLSLPLKLRERFWELPARQKWQRRRDATPPAAPGAPLMVQRFERLGELLKGLASERDVDRLLERIVDAAVELSGAERGFVLLPQAGGGLAPHLVRGELAEDPSVSFSQSIADAVLLDGQPLVTVDAGKDARLSEYLSVHRLMLRSVAGLPIRDRTGIVGVLYLEHRLRRGRFGEADIDLLLAFADQAAIALQNAKLLAELAARTKALEQANAALEEHAATLEQVLSTRDAELATTRAQLARAQRKPSGMAGLIGRSEAMRGVFRRIERVAETDVPVVIVGESGTGKELVARAVHDAGRRRGQPFVALNCGAVPASLLESELFGHVRGAFTGADRDRPGVLRRAHGGTLFLDEIADMPSQMQVDLLRVLQEGKVRPVGGAEEEAVDVRVVAASLRPLQELVDAGEFRADLFYRLAVVEVPLPPLRERHGDLPLLCTHLLQKLAKKEGVRAKSISGDAIGRLQAEALPGNVRQLEHLLLNAMVMCDGPCIEAQDLALGPAIAAKAPVASENPAGSLAGHKEQERTQILEALERAKWNRAQAARILGIPRRTFYRRLKEYGIL